MLRDGRAVHIRAMRPTDESELVQALGRMSNDARYMRFMRFVREPNLERVRKALASFPKGGIGIVATVPAADGIDIAGSATYLVGNDRTTCEFAINVASEFGGVGLASTLLTALIGAAKARGMTEMDGYVLAMKQPMLRLARRRGFTIASDPEDRTVCICRAIQKRPSSTISWKPIPCRKVYLAVGTTKPLDVESCLSQELGRICA